MTQQTPTLANQGPPPLRMSPLLQIREKDVIEKAGQTTVSVHRDGTILLDAPVTLAFLTREPPPFSQVTLHFSDRVSTNRNIPFSCAGQNAPGRVAMIQGSITSSPASPKLIAAFAQAGVALPGAGALRVNQVRVTPNGDLTAAVNAGVERMQVRAFGGPASACKANSTAAFVADMAAKATPIVLGAIPAGPKNKPGVYANVKVVGWSPAIRVDGECNFIIQKPIGDAKYTAILEYKKISTAVGTRFGLCPGDAASAYQNLPTATKIKLTVGGILDWFGSAFNWTASKFQSIAAAAGAPLKPVFGAGVAQAFGNAMLGQLPGSPLTGNFEQLADQGCAFVKQKIGAEMQESAGQELNDNQKAQVYAKVDEACAALRKAGQNASRPNEYLIFDPDKQQRPPIAYLRVTYSGVDAPAHAVGGSYPLDIEVRSKGGEGPNVVGLGGTPRLVMFKRDKFMLPDGSPGDSLILPVMLDYNGNPKSSDWGNAFVAYAGADVSAAGSTMSIMPGNAVPPPSK